MSGWISVKDRLPDTTDNVIAAATRHWGDLDCSFVTVGQCYAYKGKCVWYICDGDDCFNKVEDLNAEITHWMPLPELPGEATNDD